ncbi:hypothetical protein F4824DRAFT_500728 [Ustulina deusta]|nr:hypothetical protein F4824DRAFT_500728 [Ustulina deusta]
MASRDSKYKRLLRLMHAYFSEGSSQTPQSLYDEINHYLGRQLDNEPTEEMTEWLENFLSDFAVEYVQEQGPMLSELFNYLGQWDALLYSDPIAHTLYKVHNHIAYTGKWEKWIPYCELVGTLIEPEVELFEHEDRILRILAQAFDSNYASNVESTLVAGAAMCMSKVTKPVAQCIGANEWSLGMTRVVTPADWQRWTGRIEAFGNDKSQNNRMRQLARQAVRVMRIL